MADKGAALETAWVLHARPYRNSSLVLDMFSAGRGRLGVVARGGRRNHLLQPFRPLLVSFTGRGELLNIQQVESAGSALPLAGRALYCGMYLNELLVRLLHRNDPHPGLMAPYEATLHALATDVPAQDVLLRHFELALLDELGYSFSLTEDATGAPLRAGQAYRLDPEQGLVPAASGWPGSALLAMAAGDWQDETRRVARDVLRAALAPHLGARPLVSRELFR